MYNFNKWYNSIVYSVVIVGGVRDVVAFPVVFSIVPIVMIVKVAISSVGFVLTVITVH